MVSSLRDDLDWGVMGNDGYTHNYLSLPIFPIYNISAMSHCCDSLLLNYRTSKVEIFLLEEVRFGAKSKLARIVPKITPYHKKIIW